MTLTPQQAREMLAGLDTMASAIRHALEFDTAQRAKEGLKSTPDTHLIAPPSWPTHGCLTNWVELLESVRAIIRASDTAHRGWMPIETAPKDGRAVILYPANSSKRQYRSGPQCGAGYWHQPGNPDAKGYWVTGNGFSHPTHWQPLPAAPQKEGV